MANKLFTPKTNKWIAGISSIVLGASQITAPIDLKSYIPEFFTTPFIGNVSFLTVSAYGAFIGGIMVLMKITE
jgi:hypothetical protein